MRISKINSILVRLILLLKHLLLLWLCILTCTYKITINEQTTNYYQNHDTFSFLDGLHAFSKFNVIEKGCNPSNKINEDNLTNVENTYGVTNLGEDYLHHISLWGLLVMLMNYKY